MSLSAHDSGGGETGAAGARGGEEEDEDKDKDKDSGRLLTYEDAWGDEDDDSPVANYDTAGVVYTYSSDEAPQYGAYGAADDTAPTYELREYHEAEGVLTGVAQYQMPLDDLFTWVTSCAAAFLRYKVFYDGKLVQVWSQVTASSGRQQWARQVFRHHMPPPRRAPPRDAVVYAPDEPLIRQAARRLLQAATAAPR